MPTCEHCGNLKVQVNDAFICLSCSGKKSPKPNPNYTPPKDPGEDWFNKGQNSVPEVPKSAPIQTIAKPAQSLIACVKQAVAIMESAPMPKDIKEFKAVTKAIKYLNALLEDKSNA